jgi:pimeloyl-ACP methyl ester carboxylesterase
MDDVRAVMDAVGSQQAILFGNSEGCAMSALFAATYPERVSKLLLYGGYVNRLDLSSKQREERALERAKLWGTGAMLKGVAPNLFDITKKGVNITADEAVLVARVFDQFNVRNKRR